MRSSPKCGGEVAWLRPCGLSRMDVVTFYYLEVNDGHQEPLLEAEEVEDLLDNGGFLQGLLEVAEEVEGFRMEVVLQSRWSRQWPLVLLQSPARRLLIRQGAYLILIFIGRETHVQFYIAAKRSLQDEKPQESTPQRAPARVQYMNFTHIGVPQAQNAPVDQGSYGKPYASAGGYSAPDNKLFPVKTSQPIPPPQQPSFPVQQQPFQPQPQPFQPQPLMAQPFPTGVPPYSTQVPAQGYGQAQSYSMPQTSFSPAPTTLRSSPAPTGVGGSARGKYVLDPTVQVNSGGSAFPGAGPTTTFPQQQFTPAPVDIYNPSGECTSLPPSSLSSVVILFYTQLHIAALRGRWITGFWGRYQGMVRTEQKSSGAIEMVQSPRSRGSAAAVEVVSGADMPAQSVPLQQQFQTPVAANTPAGWNDPPSLGTVRNQVATTLLSDLRPQQDLSQALARQLLCSSS
ncbi:hypothetical protein PR048_032873 [Dryococelus australis]|uniref:Uncharacterized protein n=1 Tax=Dryococelus australis TaxID=614101 RepID=A0ABQ9G693_9NEOP|nr:hypothetical protein PR048_032873 [Dryococelus australis]